MIRLPQRTRLSKVGSNLAESESLSRQLTREMEVRNVPYRKANAAFVRQRGRILTKEAIEKAIPIIESHRRSFDRSFLNANGDVDTIVRTKAKTQKSINTALPKLIPKYKQYRALEEAYLRKQLALSKAETRSRIKNSMEISLADEASIADADTQEFTPTFELFNVTTAGLGDPDLLRFNESFAEPHSGILVQNLKYLRNDDDITLPSQARPPAGKEVSCSLGATYKVPRTGHLRFTAIVQSSFNKIDYSVADNLGFSHAEVNFRVSLFLAIIRSGQIGGARRDLLTGGILSRGEDYSFTAPLIPDTTPFVLRFNPKTTFQEGEIIRVLAGSRILIDSFLSAMKCFVDAVLMWDVQKLRVSIRP